MNQKVSRTTLKSLLQVENVTDLAYPELIRLFKEEKSIADFLPEGVVRVDPRNSDRIIYNSARSKRPRDYRPRPTSGTVEETDCAICQGKTTGIIDVINLSEGFTFINKNLFPILYPIDSKAPSKKIGDEDQTPEPCLRSAYGFHFLQWTSSHHDKDWHNMPIADCAIVMKRIAALEKKLLVDTENLLLDNEQHGDQRAMQNYVLIIKNYGRLVGASLIHGHQQIALSNIMPRRMMDNIDFERDRSEPFSSYLSRENPPDLLVKDYGSAILMVPYFMRRPYDMFLLVKDTSKKHFHELTEAEIIAVAEGWHDATRGIHKILPEIGKEVAYNVTTSNGPGSGLYFEFLPYSQYFGGFEHLGLFVCQETPDRAASRMRSLLSE